MDIAIPVDGLPQAVARMSDLGMLHPAAALIIIALAIVALVLAAGAANPYR